MSHFSENPLHCTSEQNDAVALCCYIARMTQALQAMTWPGNQGCDLAHEDAVEASAGTLYQARAVLLNRLVDTITEYLGEEKDDPGLLETMPVGDYHVDAEGQITRIGSARDDLTADDIRAEIKTLCALGPGIYRVEAGGQFHRISASVTGAINSFDAALREAEAALAPFAKIHERRSEGSPREAVASSSPAACSVQDCQAAWLALNPAPANAVRDADPDLGDEEPGQ